METTIKQEQVTPTDMLNKMKLAMKMREVLKTMALFDFVGMQDLAFDFAKPSKEKIDEFEKLQQAYVDTHSDRYAFFKNVAFAYNPEDDVVQYSYFVTDVVESKEFKNEKAMLKEMDKIEFLSQGVKRSDGKFFLNVIDIKKNTDVKVSPNVHVTYPLDIWMEMFNPALESNGIKEIFEEYVGLAKEMYELQKTTAQ